LLFPLDTASATPKPTATAPKKIRGFTCKICALCTPAGLPAVRGPVSAAKALVAESSDAVRIVLIMRIGTPIECCPFPVPLCGTREQSPALYHLRAVELLFPRNLLGSSLICLLNKLRVTHLYKPFSGRPAFLQSVLDHSLRAKSGRVIQPSWFIICIAASWPTAARYDEKETSAVSKNAATGRELVTCSRLA
jgi:hypothetical protein